MYPAYPDAKFTPSDHSPKLPVSELMAIYDQLTALGLQLLPKQRNKKLPLFSYWDKSTRDSAIITREIMEQEQQRDDVSGWCIRCGSASGRLYVLDFDTAEIEKHGIDSAEAYKTAQEMSPSRFVLGSPANGAHIYYRIPAHREMLTNVKPPIRGVDGRGEGGQVVTRGGFNWYNQEDDPVKKGVQRFHAATYETLPLGCYTEIPEMSDELYDWLTSGVYERRQRTPEHDAGEVYGTTEAGSERVKRHFEHTLAERETVTLECLSAILENWDAAKTYEDWLQMWMSAHHSAATTTVRDYILNHPKVSWRDGERGRLHFLDAFDGHTQRDGGYTVASLFYLARKAGWLTRTGIEINANAAQHIHSRYVATWMADQLELPRRLALVSQTGTGKTQNLIALWNRLDQPKTVVFVPTVKLAMELHATLTRGGLPSVLYIDAETLRTKDTEILENAQVLVTTLQTFSLKLRRAGVSMKSYGLVYLEEADQLISGFARGGGGLNSSQVREGEARTGFAVLREACLFSGYVWAVDATMTQITYNMMQAMCDQPVRVIQNDWIEPKASVKMLNTQDEAHQSILEALIRKQKVVVACDTAAGAEAIYDTFTAMKLLTPENSILITRRTERDPRVFEFMQDVNAGAERYQVVVYNSVMASGVSITSVQPDTLVLISTYLTPRANLQLLNRYRKQGKVLVYVRGTENLYSKHSQELLKDLRGRMDLESQLIRMPVAVRTSDAELRAELAALSIADGELQQRAPREFFAGLLYHDGRTVNYSTDHIELSQTLQHTIEGVRAARKERAQEIARKWRLVRPIDQVRPPDPTMTDFEVACGERHAEIERLLAGNIPDGDNAEIDRIVSQFEGNVFSLTAFVQQRNALQRAEAMLADKDRAITTFQNQISRLTVVALVRELYPDLAEPITSLDFAKRAPEFLRALERERTLYDAVVPRSRQKFEMVFDAEDPIASAVSFSKILLSMVGLKQRCDNLTRREGEYIYSYRIANYDDAMTFLGWRYPDETIELSATVEPIRERVEARMDAYAQFRALDKDQQAQVMELIADGQDFETSVLTVGGEMW